MISRTVKGKKQSPGKKTCGGLKNVMIKAIIKLSRYDFYIIQALHLLMFDDTLLLAGRSRQVCTSIDPMEKRDPIHHEGPAKGGYRAIMADDGNI